jgi:oligopeptide/dipeptide ABC transporter ATP-binding protein
MTNNSENLLNLKNLRTIFRTSEDPVIAVNDVSININKGEIVGIVGESGCGKSVTALSIMRLVPNPPGEIVSGEILLEGNNLLSINESEMEKIRGKEIGMIFQEPMTSLNPVLTIGKQITEILELHQGMDPKEAIAEAVRLLTIVGLPDPEIRVNEYPHQLSGGQRQRVMIAIALSCNPKILIADEPTTALDVTIQAQILELIKDLTTKMGTAVILITHNLGILARYADRIYVMYGGHVVESGNIMDIYNNPKHPYTVGLLNSVPTLEVNSDVDLPTIPGEVHDLSSIKGCVYRARCVKPTNDCKEGKIEMGLIEIKPGHWVDQCCVNCK